MPQRPHRHLLIPARLVGLRDTEFEGGGTVYPRADFREHGRQLLRNLSVVTRTVERSNDPLRDRKVFFMLETAPDVTLREKYETLRSKLGIQVVSALTQSSGLATSDKDTFESLHNRVGEYAESDQHKGKSYFSFIERLSPIPADAKLSPSLKHSLEDGEGPFPIIAHLFSTLTPDESILVTDAIRGVAHRFRGNADDAFMTASGHWIVPATLSRQAIEYLAENYPSVMQLDRNDPLVLPELSAVEQLDLGLEVGTCPTDVTVGIIDTGINAGNALLAPFVDGIYDRTPGGSDHNLVHGSFVASRVIFGDSLAEQIGRGLLEPKVRVRDIRFFYRVNGAQRGPSPFDFAVWMKRIVNDNPDIKIFNLSFVYPSEVVTDDQVTFVASELDALARQHDVLFVVAAGNYTERPTDSYPDYFSQEKTRIFGPADHFLGLSVGSVARFSNGGAMSLPGEPSPFSRRGPAVGGARKPDVAAHGGNMTQTWSRQTALDAVGLDTNANQLRYDSGTSHSTPIVSSYAAQILGAYPLCSSAMLKAILVHSAQLPISPRFTVDKMVRHVGNGIPNLDRALQSVGSRVSYLFEGVLPTQKYQSIKFRVPQVALTNRTGPKLRVKVTLAYNPPTNRALGFDYSAVHIWAKLRKINSKGNLVDVPHDSAEESPEDCRDRFFPLVNFTKEFTSGFQAGDWEVLLRMSTKWDVGRDFTQRYALVITVEDPGGTLDLFTAIQNEVPDVYQEATRTVIRQDEETK